jgi:predicted nucleotidyltransferase
MDALKDLVGRLEHAFSGRLVSVVLYGSAATGENVNDRLADLNVLCVLKDITPQELSEGEPILKWWREKGNPSPLLMSEEEVHNSADSFPIEFKDMKERRKVLYGPDVIADVKVEAHYYRAQVEHDLRSKLLRLRQQGAQRLSDPAGLLKLCMDSVSTFCVLGRHVLEVAGIKAKTERRAVVRQLAHTLEADLTPFEVLLDLREDKAGTDPGDPGELFAQYLVCINRLIAFVDGLEEK